MESRRMVLMILFTEQQWRRRHRERTYEQGWERRRGGWDEWRECMGAYSLCCAVLSRSVVSDSVTSWTAAHQAPLSTGFSRQEYWSGLPYLSPGDLSNPGIEPRFPTLQADSLLSEPPESPRILEWVAFPFSREHPDPGIKQGLLHCRQILYQLSYQGSPKN